MAARVSLGRTALIAGSVGAACCAATLIDAAAAPRAALDSWLAAYAFWLGVCLGCLGWLMTFHAGKARWIVVSRRLLEGLAATVPPLAVLFVPIALGLRHIFPWATAAAPSGEEASLLAFRNAYLRVPFFLSRAVAYFALWTLLGHLLLRWSVLQDDRGGPAPTAWQRRLSGFGLVALAITGTFAAFDWMMSLEPDWISTTFGFYFLSGAMMGGLALFVLLLALADRRGLLGDPLRPSHWHNLGKLLFATLCFWAYIAFTQYLLIWIADKPVEVRWYVTRTGGGWGGVAIALVVLHFAFPFFVLLSRDFKRRRGPLAATGIWLLLVHYLDVYWIVMPATYRAGPAPRWTDLLAAVGIGGLVLAYAAWRLDGHSFVPAGDPYLDESLAYERS